MKHYLVTTAAVTLLGLCLSAHAGKEQFERTKPHVNVGTIGKVKSLNSNGGTSAGFEIQKLMSTYNQSEQLELLKKEKRASKLTQN